MTAEERCDEILRIIDEVLDRRVPDKAVVWTDQPSGSG
jgi:hypothetical protein